MKPGDVIGEKWRLERKLGEGGFAVVFSAVDLASGDRVAIKLLRQGPGGYDRDTLSRYHREIDTLAKLRCEHTVRLLGYGNTTDGSRFMVFEHVDGVELAEVIAQRAPLPSHAIIHVLGQLLRALDEAHKLGLLHRDIKPHNILVYERDGDPWAVKLIDFGIARSVDPDATTVTQTGALVGTPKYMSPEQLLKFPLTPASDLYSLGLVAFEMALGRDALHGASIGDQIDRLRSGHLFSVPELDRLGARLHQTISRMCAREAQARFQSAHAVLVALDLGPESPVVVEDRPWSMKQQAAAVLGVAMLVAALLMLLLWPEPESKRPLKVVLPTADPQEQTVPSVPTPPPKPEPIVHESAGCWENDPRRPAENLHLPVPAREGPIPLVVLFHDAGVDHLRFLRESGFVELADERGFAVLSLAGKPTESPEYDPWRRPKEGPLDFRTDPMPRVHNEIASVLDERCIDPRRVFAVGHSKGARAARTMGCTELVSAVASVSSMDIGGECRPEDGQRRNIPRIRFNPMDSGHHPVFGGPLCHGTDPIPGLNVLESSLAEQTGCTTDDPPFDERIRTRQQRTWSCKDDVPIESHLVPGGQNWGKIERVEGADPLDCDGEVADVDYAREIWAFFEREVIEPQKSRPSMGCGVGGVLNATSGVSYLPSNRDPDVPIPLVVLVHDNNETAKSLLETSGLIETAEKHGFAILAPEGLEGSTWKMGTATNIRAEFERFVESECVDLDRVYAVGNGRGGKALTVLGCEDWFDAVAIAGHTPAPDPADAAQDLHIALPCKPSPKPTLLLRSAFRIGTCDDERAPGHWKAGITEYASAHGCEPPIGTGSDLHPSCDDGEGCNPPLSSCASDGSLWDANDRCDRGKATFPVGDVIWRFFESTHKP